MQFMRCPCCGHTVQVNPTGTCLGCQQGFSGPQADVWKPSDAEPEKKGVLDYAIEEGIIQENNLSKHQDRNENKTTETSSRNRIKHRGKK